MHAGCPAGCPDRYKRAASIGHDSRWQWIRNRTSGAGKERKGSWKLCLSLNCTVMRSGTLFRIDSCESRFATFVMPANLSGSEILPIPFASEEAKKVIYGQFYWYSCATQYQHT